MKTNNNELKPPTSRYTRSTALQHQGETKDSNDLNKNGSQRTAPANYKPPLPPFVPPRENLSLAERVARQNKMATAGDEAATTKHIKQTTIDPWQIPKSHRHRRKKKDKALKAKQAASKTKETIKVGRKKATPSAVTPVEKTKPMEFDTDPIQESEVEEDAGDTMFFEDAYQDDLGAIEEAEKDEEIERTIVMEVETEKEKRRQEIESEPPTKKTNRNSTPPTPDTALNPAVTKLSTEMQDVDGTEITAAEQDSISRTTATSNSSRMHSSSPKNGMSNEANTPEKPEETSTVRQVGTTQHTTIGNNSWAQTRTPAATTATNAVSNTSNLGYQGVEDTEQVRHLLKLTAALEKTRQTEIQVAKQSSNMTKEQLRVKQVKEKVRDVQDNYDTLRRRIVKNRSHLARYELRVKVAPSDDPVKEVHSVLQGIFRKLQESDKRVCIYPWLWSDASGPTPLWKGLDAPNQLAPTPKDLRIYFPGVQLNNKKGGTQYLSVMMGHMKPFDKVMEPIGLWFKENQFTLYRQQIQCEYQHVVGWLLYSVWSMDIDKLQQEMSKWCGFQVYLRWQIINTGYNKDLEEADKIKAIHIRVDAKLQEEAISMLGSFYRQDSTSFPLGYKMRLIPPIDRMMNPGNSEKFQKLRYRQRAFNKRMITVLNYEIISLFHIGNSTADHLHTLIMQIPSVSFPGTPLFHCVDRFNKQGNAPTKLLCHPDDESFARSLNAGIIPYLRHILRSKYKPGEKFSSEESQFMVRRLYTFFTEEALKRSLGCEWCTKERGVVSRREVDAILALNEDNKFSFGDEGEATSTQQATADSQMTRKSDQAELPPPSQYQAGDVDSISTTWTRNNKSSIRDASSSGTTDKEVHFDLSNAENEEMEEGEDPSTQDDGKQAEYESRSIATNTSKSTKSSKSKNSISSVTTAMNSFKSSIDSKFSEMFKQFTMMNERLHSLEKDKQEVNTTEGPSGDPPDKPEDHLTHHPPQGDGTGP